MTLLSASATTDRVSESVSFQALKAVPIYHQGGDSYRPCCCTGDPYQGLGRRAAVGDSYRGGYLWRRSEGSDVPYHIVVRVRRLQYCYC